jgi:uncharacterized protein
MSPEVARAIASGIPDNWPSSGFLDLVWHGGEPLTVGTADFIGLLEPFEDLRLSSRVQHVIQTNATLVTDEWCEIFRTYDLAVGVSLDGPPDANVNRADWGGKPAFERIVNGINILRRNEISFSAIAVIGKESLDRASEILDFLARQGCAHVGINIEEKEGINTRNGTPTLEEASDLWRQILHWARENPGTTVREVDELFTFLALDAPDRASDAEHDLIPTIGWNGDVTLLSPELLGIHAPQYANFVAGNVTATPLSEILGRAGDLRYVQEFEVGIQNCKASCGFFAFCQGSHAGNRYFEHGNFTATETEHCKTSTQAIVLALADLTREGN